MNAQQLKNSILQMAVQGKLVPQDPNDEPASVLLERIREEKEKLIKEGKIKKEKNPSYIFRGEDNLPYEKVGKNDPVCIADEVPFEIPESWEWVRLFNLGDNINDAFADGPFGSNLKKEHYTDRKEVRLIQLSNIGEEGWRNENTKYTTYSHAETLSRSMVKPGAIVIAKMMPAGRAIIVPDCEKDYILSSDAVKFIPHNLLNVDYLVIAINSPVFRNQVVSEAHGVTRIRTSLGKLQTYLLPVPPLSEQQRIVNQFRIIQPLIKEYEIAEGKRISLNEAFPELLKKSILQQAVMGKLVPQDPNDEPASILLEKIRTEKDALIKAGKLKKDKHEGIIYRRDNSHYEKRGKDDVCIDNEIPFDIPESWSWCYLGTISFVTKLAGFEYTKYIADNLKTSGIPLFKGKNVQNGNLVLSFESYIEEELSDELYRSQITRKCLLTPYVGTIGNIAIFDGSFKAHLGSNVGKIEICNPEREPQVTEEYVLHYLRSSTGYDELTKYKKATAQESISIEAIRNVLIPIPPLNEQIRITKQIEKLFGIVDTL